MRDYQKNEKLGRNIQAKDYDSRYISSKWRSFDNIEKNIFKKLTPSWNKILDLWAGTWRISEAIKDKAKEIFSIDFSEESINLLNKKNISNIHTSVVDITQKLPLKDKYFDSVVSCQVIQHLQLDDLLNTLKETHRVLKKWWYFIFSVYNLWFIFHKKIYEKILDNGLYTKKFNREFCRYLAEKTNFTIKYIWYYGVNPLLHIFDHKINILIEKILSKIPFLNKILWRYLIVIFKKNNK